jgi:hypothetical protein
MGESKRRNDDSLGELCGGQTLMLMSSEMIDGRKGLRCEFAVVNLV